MSPLATYLTRGSAAFAAAASLAFLNVQPARSAPLTEINFSEAVHNLGYIDLYVGMHAGIFKKHGLDLKVSAAGGDTQTFAAVLGGSAQFAIGDPTMVEISREHGGPGEVIGTVVQRAHYFAVASHVPKITNPKQFKGLTIATSPDPNTNYSVTKKLLQDAGLQIGSDVKMLPVNPGTEIAAMLAGRADVAIAYQPGVAEAEAQGAKIVFDFSNSMGPFCNTGIMTLPDYAKAHPDVVHALLASFEEADRMVYSNPGYAKQVAREEFPELPATVVNRAIDEEIEYKIPAQSVVVEQNQWTTLMAMQKYLGNVKNVLPTSQVVNNTYAEQALKAMPHTH
ncbi:MAG TPA: ABC transporter substrate-binding protein [Candidatus Limnocylindria bacterium]|nr:ABC transporter substrate-binding protein [Candidatus Limnocylindria bacterium]